MGRAAERGLESLRYRCATKARRTEGVERLERGHRWVTSRRAWFNIVGDRIECGPWTIPFDDIEEAVIHETRSAFVPVRVLELRLVDESYQFGFNPWARPWDHLPIEFSFKRTSMHYSLLSIAIRVALVAGLVSLVLLR